MAVPWRVYHTLGRSCSWHCPAHLSGGTDRGTWSRTATQTSYKHLKNINNYRKLAKDKYSCGQGCGSAFIFWGESGCFSQCFLRVFSSWKKRLVKSKKTWSSSKFTNLKKYSNNYYQFSLYFFCYFSIFRSWIRIRILTRRVNECESMRIRLRNTACGSLLTCHTGRRRSRRWRGCGPSPPPAPGHHQYRTRSPSPTPSAAASVDYNKQLNNIALIIRI